MPPNSHSRVIAAHGGGKSALAAKAKARPNPNAAVASSSASPPSGSSSTIPDRGETCEGPASGSAAPSSSDPRQRRRQNQRQQPDNDNDTRQQSDLPMVSYIPSDMRDFVHPYHGDFCYSFHFHPQLLVQLMAEGFLPIATSTPSRIGATPTYVLLPKLHEHRCVVPLRPGAGGGPHHDEPPESHPKQSMGHPTDFGGDGGAPQLHVSRSVRKRSSRYIISCNHSWPEVVEACQIQHGRSSWLYPPLVEALTALHRQSAAPGNPPTAAIRASGDGGPAPGSNRQRQQPPLIRVPFRLYSIEVWREHGVEDSEGSEMKEDETGSRDAVGVHRTVLHHPRHGTSSLPPTPTLTPRRTRRTLVAGELGYTVGAVYTSLTGFTNESGAGTVQLAALGRWLQQSGFQLWDLGMEMEYKLELGAVLIPRRQFVNAVREWRLPPHGDLVLTCSETGNNCRDVIDNK